MNAIYVLIIFAHMGSNINGNSNAITTHEFSSQESCQAAGAAAMKITQGTGKKIEFVCAKK